jgi:hypothetical protein
VTTPRAPQTPVPSWGAPTEPDDTPEPAQTLSDPVIDPAQVSFLS